MGRQGSMSGEMISKKYILGDLLGEGGFGEVYKTTNGPYAVKLLLEEYCNDEKSVRRFVDEALWLSRLNHPNIITIHDLDIDRDRIYMVMPFIESTLDAQVKKKGSLGLKRTKKYLKQICAALDYIHEKGAVHLDIKPPNILRDNDKTLFISDFGLAHLIGQVDGKTGLVRLDKSKAKTSMKMGTIHYMAPERLAWRPEKRSDIYSVGVMLYEMLTGKVPFDGSFEQILDMHLTQPPPPPSKVRRDLPGEVDTVVKKAMAKKPEDRYATAHKLYKAFKEAIAEDDDW